MTSITDILDAPWVYGLWQSPFFRQKLAPVVRHHRLTDSTRVLDVGCGPGTNTAHFAACSHYVGIDMNPRYIDSARRRYHREFVTADVRTYLPEDDCGYDLILANSFFHHIDDENTTTILHRLQDLLAPEGEIHILDLVLPDRFSISRWLARHDRGDHPRPLDRWRELFDDAFTPVVFEPYPVKALGTVLWQMVYFKGQKARAVNDDGAFEQEKVHATRAS